MGYLPWPNEQTTIHMNVNITKMFWAICYTNFSWIQSYLMSSTEKKNLTEILVIEILL